MTRRSVTLVAALLCFNHLSVAQVAPTTLAARVQASVVAITATAAQAPPSPIKGSGTLISSDGLILTAASLVEGGADISVTLAGGRSLPATLVGRDKATGLALLRIEAEGLPHLVPASAAGLAAGERLLIFGRSPLQGESPTLVSNGTASRAYDPALEAVPFLVTPAPLLAGMGGGPVVREATGAFVAVATQQYVPTAGAPVTLAVPLDEYLPIAADLLATGRADRGTIGTRIRVLSAEQAQGLGLPAQPAIAIVDVRPGGAADKAGILPGDMVLAVDGVDVTSASTYLRAITTKRSGTAIELTVYRNGRTLKQAMTTDRAP